MKNKENIKNIKGITLIEMLIAVAVTSLMVGAMITSYTLVNNSYNQVSDRAKVSRSSRDIVGMMVRDIRLAGFKYYFGENTEEIAQFEDLTHISGNEDDYTLDDSHDPIIVFKDRLGYSPKDDTVTTDISGGTVGVNKWPDLKSKCCDQIRIVYGDFSKGEDQKYKKYRITYYAMPMEKNENDKFYGVYKAKETWIETDETPLGSWSSSCSECYKNELIRSHLVDMEFLLFDENGKHLFNIETRTYPQPDNDSSVDLYRIAQVDFRLTFRSNKDFYRTKGTDQKQRLVLGLGDDREAENFNDKYLRDSVVVSVSTRNIGIN